MHTSARLVVLLVPFLAAACATHEDPTSPASPRTPADAGRDGPVATPPDPTPDDGDQPEPEPSPTRKVAIASVQMIQDCPDPAPPATPAAGAPAEPAMERAKPMAAKRGASARGGGPGIRQPCTQSTMQLSFSGPSQASARVVIERVRVLDAESKDSLATIGARRPMAWAGDAYREWDEIVPPGDEMKASYSLAVPDWNDVEAKIGGASFGHMFVLEVVLTVDGERRTVQSAAFARERPHVIVT